MLTSVLWNLAGSALPLLAGLWAVPVLDRELGTAGLGLLALAWTLVGYFSLLDLGLGRAITRAVAQAKAQCLPREWVLMLVARLGYLLWALGMIGGVLVAWATLGLSGRLVPHQNELAADLPMAVTWLALCLPWVVATASWRGVLEGLGQFRLLNLIRIPLGTALFVAPAVVALQQGDLSDVMASLLLTRVVGWWAHRLAARRALHALDGSERSTADQPSLGALLRFGGWITVSNVVGPLMVYADRFAIGFFMSASAVAIYVAPYEVATRLTLLASAMAGVLFPLVASHIGLLAQQAREAYRLSLSLATWGTGLGVICLFVFAESGLSLWLGAQYATQGTGVARWLLLGVWLNAVGLIALAAVQAAGRADWTAKLHAVELPFYLIGLSWAAWEQELDLIALVWALRAGVDALALLFMAHRLSGCPWRDQVPLNVLLGLLSGAVLLGSWIMLGESLTLGVLVVLIYGVMALPATWYAATHFLSLRTA